MGFVLSILYFLASYLTPQVMFGSLAEYRIELILAAVITAISVPALSRSGLSKTPQLIALGGLCFATFMSLLIGQGWASGGITAVLIFLPNAFGYVLVGLHCNTKRRVQIVILMMLFVCLFVIVQGVLQISAISPDINPRDLDMSSTYFMGMNNGQKEWFFRLRGLGLINDPNDFAQMIVSVLPLLFFFWKKADPFRNFFVVLLPAGILLYGAFLTHSRGSILALLAVIIVALRKRIGTVPAVLLAAILFAGATATGFTGGRDISTNAGEDRMEYWGEGLELLKAHPFFGVGFGDLPDYIPGHHTAHNTVVVCAAELGFCGLFFWSMFLFPCYRETLAVANPKGVAERKTVALTDSYFGLAPPSPTLPEEAEIRRLGWLLALSMTGYLVTGWFLSRAFILTFFLLGGLTEVTYQMALQRGMVSPPLPMRRVLRYSGLLAIGLVLLMYIMLRIMNLSR